MDAYNEGRHEQLLDPDVNEYFPAMYLSAVLDGRNRKTHGKADGLTFMVTDPVWRRLRPTNGYNCREVIIPISKYDFTRDILNSYDDIPRGYPDPGFG
jgi:SPP1 gp7 family putative phage head morphogenesis protein